jgi:hypothetical protein
MIILFPLLSSNFIKCGHKICAGLEPDREREREKKDGTSTALGRKGTMIHR